MTYSEPQLWQVYNFLFFFGFGFLCGLLFRLIEFIRELFSRKKAAVIAQDLIFSVLATVLMFIFLLTYADGKVRLNLIFAAASGAAVFFMTLGKAVKNLLGFLGIIIKKTVSFLVKPFILLALILKKAGSFITRRTKEKTAVLKEKRSGRKKENSPTGKSGVQKGKESKKTQSQTQKILEKSQKIRIINVCMFKYNHLACRTGVRIFGG